MYFPNTPPKLIPNLHQKEPPSEIPPRQKGQNPKKYVMQNFQELKFVDNLYCSQRGSLRLFRFHPFSKYMASKLVCSVPSSSLPEGHSEQLLKQYQERCRIRQPHIIYSIASESQNIHRNTSLGQMELFQIYIFFEFNQLNLDQQADKRSKEKALLPEAEAWCLMKGVVSGMLYLQQKEISHGMISLHNVFFDEEYLLYRLYDQELINGKWGDWLRCQQYKRGKANKFFTKSDYDETLKYLAPECIKYLDIDLQLMEEKINPYKADVYAFGVTAVNFMSLKQFQTLDKAMDFLKKYYSKDLTGMLESCLEISPQTRPDWVQLQNKLNTIPDSTQTASSTTAPSPNLTPQQKNPNPPLNQSFQNAPLGSSYNQPLGVQNGNGNMTLSVQQQPKSAVVSDSQRMMSQSQQNLPYKQVLSPSQPLQNSDSKKSPGPILNESRMSYTDSYRDRFKQLGQASPAVRGSIQTQQDEDVELRLQQLNQKIQETLAKSFSKTKVIQ